MVQELNLIARACVKRRKQHSIELSHPAQPSKVDDTSVQQAVGGAGDIEERHLIVKILAIMRAQDVCLLTGKQNSFYGQLCMLGWHTCSMYSCKACVTPYAYSKWIGASVVLPQPVYSLTNIPNHCCKADYQSCRNERG